jgi:hypothetical protein
MDPLFWILAGVVLGCVIGIIIIWRLERQAERRAADTKQVEATISARLKIFDPRAAVEATDTLPIPATKQPGARKPAHQEPATLPREPQQAQPPGSKQSARAAASPTEASAIPPPEIQVRPPPAGAPAGAVGENGTGLAYGNIEYLIPAQASHPTPEHASLRAAELGRERRYLEQTIEEQQARLAELLQSGTGVSEEKAAISLLQSELEEQRQQLEEMIFLEERYRQVATPSLEQLAQDYKNAASPQTPRAFGVRRHSLARIEPPDQNPPAPPTQASTDSSS